MLRLLSPVKSIGLELSSSSLKLAEVNENNKSRHLLNLSTLSLDAFDVKRLYNKQPVLTTGIDSSAVLLRPLRLPLTKEKDIEEALTFQAEPLLPYPVDQALLARQTLKKEEEETELLLLTTRKDDVQSHLEKCQAWGIEPEKISCSQEALYQFGRTYIADDQTYLILHTAEQTVTCLLIKEGVMAAAFSQKEDLRALAEKGEEAERLKRAAVKMVYALSKELSSQALAGLVIAGEAAKWPNLVQNLALHLNLSLLPVKQQNDGFSEQDKLLYAVPIGLALSGLPTVKSPVDFRQQELSYPHPWRRLKKPLALYFGLMIGLSVVFYSFSQFYLDYRENQLKQEYVDLLTGINKSYEQFEIAFLAKTPSAREKFQGEVVDVIHLGQEDLSERLAFLQKDLQATPDSFPLFAHIPRVSDVLAWLSQHPAIAYQDEQGQPQSRLQIENFNYTILKRPMQGKKQEKYQVKVELEFSSPVPKWAREFHDALIAANDWVDPKGEVKWSSNRGRYKTSFYLKDKTAYPSQ